uniref:BESS domain-containing protein n=1 Tax=Glossina brevipalpis TaxID=37001 RepID=A0A1A9WMI4_9MUSC
MNYVDDPSDPDWKDRKIKIEPNTNIKLERGTPNQSKTKYSQKFCEKWVSVFSPWLARCEDDRNKPFCRACQCRLDCNRCHLQRHERTSKHARNLEILINKGEGAARQNLSIRQERSKYYQQRKKVNTSIESPDESEMGMGDDYIEEADAEPGSEQFHFESAEHVSSDQFPPDEEIICKQENVSIPSVEEHVLERHPSSPSRNNSGRPRKVAVHAKTSEVETNSDVSIRKDGIKLLMQIHKNKNELMEFMNSSMSQHNIPLKEKNHVDLFFDSVSSSVKALSPKLIAETKMRVSQLICEMEIRAISEGDNNATTNNSSSTVMVKPETSGGTYIISQSAIAQQKSNSQLDHHHHHQQSDEDHYESLS